MLRNPIDRLVSYYKSKQGWVDSPVHNMSFSAFTDQALASRVRDSTKLGRSEAEFSLQVRKSEYCGPLDQFYSIFSADKILVVFLDSLRTNPSDCLRSVCDFVDLPSGFFEQYDFRVENQSRYHRSPLLRTMSSKANLVLEPLLNRLPWSRNALRRVYNFANVTTSKSHRIDKDSITKLEDHFAPYNRELRTLLEKQNVTTDLPSWLNH
jgi:hypothetical protein